MPRPPADPLPGPLHWIDPRHADPDHPAIRDWQAQIAAGRIATPPADPAHVVVHAANTALIARRRREGLA